MKEKKLFITGHSLGGTMGLLQAAELRDNNPLLYTYGMPRVLTISGAKSLSSLHHYRHVNDADTVTSVPFDTNMDNWLFDIGGSLGTALGALWTSFTLSTIPLQKSLPDFGEVYCHHGHPVSFFRALADWRGKNSQQKRAGKRLYRHETLAHERRISVLPGP
ncbi:hypothetical protein WKC53_12485 [Morganella morganii]|uniref:lipase family protein n=1 Tax=Morganella morganii TaxID=582 RepID=UPI0030FF1A92